MRISDWSSDVCSSDLFEMRSAPVVGGVNVQKGNGEIIRMRRGASISDFADKIESLTGYTVQPGTLVTILFNLGEMATATESLDEATFEDRKSTRLNSSH